MPLSMCRWKSLADDARGRLTVSSQAKSPSAPEAIEDQLRSGGSPMAIVIVRGRLGPISTAAMPEVTPEWRTGPRVGSAMNLVLS